MTKLPSGVDDVGSVMRQKRAYERARHRTHGSYGCACLSAGKAWTEAVIAATAPGGANSGARPSSDERADEHGFSPAPSALPVSLQSCHILAFRSGGSYGDLLGSPCLKGSRYAAARFQRQPHTISG
jgi:hypothetical protein